MNEGDLEWAGVMEECRKELSCVCQKMAQAVGWQPRSRDGHGIPKCSPCPSMFFLIPPGPSVHFHVFFGWRVRMSIIQTAKIPKISKIGAKSVGSVY